MKVFPKFRESLFWDIRQEQLNPEQHKLFIVSRVMHRGKLDEWKAIDRFYGSDEIRMLLPRIKWQDGKTEALYKLWYN